MSNPNQQLTKTDARTMEYVPYGAADKIKLTITIVRDLVAVPTRSGKLPTDAECIKFMMMCQAKRLNPFEGDAFLIGYDGSEGAKFSLITAHQTYLKRAENSPDYDGMLSGIIVEEEDQIKEVEGDFYTTSQRVIGGWAKVYHKKRAHPTYRRIRLERFNKGFAQWKEDAAGMICKCAEADALRATFPTMLGGLYLKQEVQEVSGAVEVVETAPRLPAPQEEQPSLIEPPASKRGRKGQAEAKAPPPNEPPASQPAGAVSEPAPAGAPGQKTTQATTAKDRLVKLLFDDAKVPFGDFIDFLENQGILRNASSFPSVEDLPSTLWEVLDQLPEKVTKIVRTYGQAGQIPNA